MKSEGAELLFKLRGDRTPEEWRTLNAEAARSVGSLILQSPAFDVAVAVGAFALDLSHVREMAVGVFTLDAATLESIRHMGEQMTAAFDEIARPDGHFAQAMRQAAAAREAVGEWVASLPEETREELRRAYEDAPLCPDVDVSAGGVM